MIKKYLLLSFVSLCIVPVGMQAKPNMNRKASLDVAIENVDVKLVEKFLKREGIVDENNKKLLVETAQDVVDQCEERVSLLKSGWDCARFGWWSAWIGCGTVFCISGLRYRVLKFNDKEIKKKLGFIIAGGAVCTATGLYYLSQAWKCPTASSRLESARIIENLIKNAPLSITATDSQ
ncbi:hypothetical protein H0X06_01350 [Candidatus Dependentiae bacterium]|nr:hypothetical protein [Candidatus Dependentiae bacterium]